MSDTTAGGADLIQRYCNDGDKEALGWFYRHHSRRLWRYLVARGSDTETAYDLLSEAFLRFIQVVCKDPSAPAALLYRIAINLQIDHYRRTHIGPLSLDEALVGAAEPVSCELNDDYHCLRQVMRTLSANEQNLLLLRYWIGMTHKEVAQALRIPEGTIRRQCAAALKKLGARWGMATTGRDIDEAVAGHR